MKILVFGKTGQVATELDRYEQTHCLGRQAADLSDPKSCTDLILETDCDVIINAAAYTAVDKAEEDEDLATLINGSAPTEMAKAAAQAGKPFLHISTDYVFDGSGSVAWKPSDATEPLGAYGRSKLAGENGIKEAQGIFAILRTSWVYSAHGTNFVKTMLRLGAERDQLSIVDDQIGGPTSAKDIAFALIKIAEQLTKDQKTSGVYHFSGVPDVSWAGFATEIFRQADMDVRVIPIPSSKYPTPAARPMNSRLNCQSLAADFAIARPKWKESLAVVLDEIKL